MSSEQSSIVYSVRLPKDPPRTFDINRVTMSDVFAAIRTDDIDKALTPICKAAGLADYHLVTSYLCTSNDWAKNPSLRGRWLMSWLISEDDKRTQKNA